MPTLFPGFSAYSVTKEPIISQIPLVRFGPYYGELFVYQDYNIRSLPKKVGTHPAGCIPTSVSFMMISPTRATPCRTGRTP